MSDHGIAAWLRIWKWRSEMSLHGIAEATGIPYRTVASHYSGERAASPDQIGAYAQTMGVPHAELGRAIARLDSKAGGLRVMRHRDGREGVLLAELPSYGGTRLCRIQWRDGRVTQEPMTLLSEVRL